MAGCLACGAEAQADDQYCSRCGKRLSSVAFDDTATTQGAMDLSDVRYKLGMVYFKKGEFLRAAETWEKVSADNPNHATLERLIQEARSRAR